MEKRWRLERALLGETVDRPPGALWRHFPGDDQRYTDLARSIIDFQRDYNWDFVRAMPSRNFQVTDYGATDRWLGDPRGCREIRKRVVKRSLDWTELRPLTPTRGALSRQVECMRLVCAAHAAEETPVLQTIYSPFLQAAQLAGTEKTLRDMRLRPDRLRSALTQLTESTLRFIEALGKLDGMSGIFLVTEFATFDIMSETEYSAVALPHIRTILEHLPAEWWLNIVQVGGAAPMLRLLGDLDFQALNWDVGASNLSIADTREHYAGTICGGISDRDNLLLGTPTLLRSAIQKAQSESGTRRLILSGGGDGYITTPLGNMRAFRTHVEGAI